MIVLSEAIPYLVVVLLSYLIFVFLSERFNPFGRSDHNLFLHRRTRFARLIAFLFLITCFAVFAFSTVAAWSFAQQAIAIALGFTALSIIPSIFYLRSLYKSELKSAENQQTKEANPAIINNPTQSTAKVSQSTDATPQLPAAIQAQHSELVTPQKNINSSAGNDNRALQVKARVAEASPAEVSISEEHALELELATAHINPNLSDFDQSIAEADFRESLGEELELNEIATPNATTQSSLLFYDEHLPENQTHERLDSDKLIAQFEDLIAESDDENLSPDQIALLQNVKKQDAEIAKLKESNVELEQARERLIDDMLKMKIDLLKSKEISRKHEKQKIQALQIKDKALAIATMERKKRKIMEVTAQKAIIKLQKYTSEQARLETID